MTYAELLAHLAAGHDTPDDTPGWQASTVWRNHAVLHAHWPWPHRHKAEKGMPYPHTGAPVPA